MLERHAPRPGMGRREAVAMMILARGLPGETQVKCQGQEVGNLRAQPLAPARFARGDRRGDNAGTAIPGVFWSW